MVLTKDTLKLRLRLGILYALMGIVSVLISFLATVATSMAVGSSNVSAASVTPNLGGMSAFLAALAIHRSAVLPVILLTFSCGVLISGITRASDSSARDTSKVENTSSSVSLTDPMTMVGLLFSLTAVVLAAFLELIFISPCTSREMICWKVVDLQETVPMFNVWLLPLLALIGVVIHVVALARDLR